MIQIIAWRIPANGILLVHVMIINELIKAVFAASEQFPDQRKGKNIRYSMGDIGMAAFSVFHMQCPSFLDSQRKFADRKTRTNCQTLYQMDTIPTDNHIRKMLDPVPPSKLFPMFSNTLGALDRNGGLSKFQQLEKRILIAHDGTEFIKTQKLEKCQCCQTRKRKGGKVEHYHSMVCASIVAPGHNHAVPLEPEFIMPQDGHEKQDCEMAATKRWLSSHAKQYAWLRPIYLGDDLYSRQPICKTVQSVGANFIYVAKPSSHKTMYKNITAGEVQTRTRTVKRGRTYVIHNYRWKNNVPLRAGDDAMRVNWFEIEIRNKAGKVTYRNSFVTDMEVTNDNVVVLTKCGRARWKIENENNNTLKNHGYHLEHNFGHGKENLANLFVTMNLLAFAFHTVCDLVCSMWQKARQKIGSRRSFFEELRTITKYLVFPNWAILIRTMITGEPPPGLWAS